MIWVLYSTRYIFESRVLLIRCGPFSFRVPFNEIGSVRPSRNPLSSPACSLDRLLISWRNNSRKILISPEGQADFLHRLAQRCPQLRLQGDRLVIAAQN